MIICRKKRKRIANILYIVYVALNLTKILLCFTTKRTRPARCFFKVIQKEKVEAYQQGSKISEPSKQIQVSSIQIPEPSIQITMPKTSKEIPEMFSQ